MHFEGCLDSKSDSYPRNPNEVVSACVSDAFKGIHLHDVSDILAELKSLASEFMPMVRPPDPQEYVAFHAVSR